MKAQAWGPVGHSVFPSRWSPWRARVRVGLCLLVPLLWVHTAHAAFSVNADGTVTDTTTGLVWDRCALGSRTSAATLCAANTNATYTWADALAQVSARNTAHHLGFSDWRLPNVRELESLVDIAAPVWPTVDVSAFPDTPVDGDAWANGGHWSSTTYGSSPTWAWGVEFSFGFPTIGDKGDLLYVRLVRAGPALVGFDSLLPVVNGSCGSAHATNPLVTSAPSANLCGVGSTASSVSVGTSAYSWSCAGSNGGSIASCSASRGYTVTPNPGIGGSLSPAVAQVVAYNATPSFTASAQSGYTVSSVSGCGGVWGGGIYTVAAVTADCTVNAAFTLNTAYSGPAPTGTGTVSAALAGGASCGFASVGQQSAASVAPVPPGVTFPHGVVAFTTNSCSFGGTITVTLTYPSALPAGTQLYKYGPATAGASPSWYVHPATISGNTITYTVTDNGQGDSNNTAGVITDPGGPGIPGGVVVGVPAGRTGWWALLVALLAGMGALRMRQRRLSQR
ncbi:MAG TPA: DUF1566 domain-containing protein [Burkholderiaceae bacterium]|nr:DUF1566 domain-containing protein [Burkholderiaceae bacterium]